MSVLLMIFQNIILPVFILIGVGALLHRKFNFDLNTLSKINFYYLIPTVIFVKIYQSSLSFDLLMNILSFLIIQTALLYLVSRLVIRIFRFDPGLSASFTNSVILNNQGNFGLPVNALVFRNDPFTMSIQIMVMTFQNLLTFTFGLFSVGQDKSEGKSGRFSFLIGLAKMPVLHGLLLGLLLNVLDLTIPTFIWIPLENASQGFLSIALITLGAQVAHLKLGSHYVPILLSSLCRLIISPLLALLIILGLGLEGLTAQALLMASAFPTSRNSALLALEYKNQPEFAAQAVLVSTLLSSLTVTVVVYVAQVLF
jgi:predicted permease